MYMNTNQRAGGKNVGGEGEKEKNERETVHMSKCVRRNGTRE